MAGKEPEEIETEEARNSEEKKPRITFSDSELSLEQKLRGVILSLEELTKKPYCIEFKCAAYIKGEEMLVFKNKENSLYLFFKKVKRKRNDKEYYLMDSALSAPKNI